jgi:hypothetical protein
VDAAEVHAGKPQLAANEEQPSLPMSADLSKASAVEDCAKSHTVRQRLGKTLRTTSRSYSSGVRRMAKPTRASTKPFRYFDFNSSSNSCSAATQSEVSSPGMPSVRRRSPIK